MAVVESFLSKSPFFPWKMEERPQVGNIEELRYIKLSSGHITELMSNVK